MLITIIRIIKKCDQHPHIRLHMQLKKSQKLCPFAPLFISKTDNINPPWKSRSPRLPSGRGLQVVKKIRFCLWLLFIGKPEKYKKKEFWQHAVYMGKRDLVRAVNKKKHFLNFFIFLNIFSANWFGQLFFLPL